MNKVLTIITFVGVVLMLIGLAGQAFAHHGDDRGRPGDDLCKLGRKGGC